VFRILWRRRALVALGAALALGLMLKMMGGGEGNAAIASTNVLLDTPRHQLVDRASSGVAALGWRASFLAELVGAESAKREIARAVQIPPEALTVVAPELNVPSVPASLPKAASEGAVAAHGDYVLITRTDGVLPLIKIRAQAPDREEARLLASAALSLIKAGRFLGPSPDSPRFEVARAGAIKSRAAPAESELARALALSVIFFCFWCAAIFTFEAGLAWWRTSAGKHPMEA
jgi:hypothetical protein